MSTYVIGDIHGCFDTLKRLLRKIQPNYDQDHLWLTGDLVNRGPESLQALRWARATQQQMGKRFVTVLGNHDLHLLALVLGYSRRRGKDTLDPLLAAEDRPRLVRWLLAQPLIHRRKKTLLVHAGLLPSWKPKQAERLARAIEQRLRGPAAKAILSHHPRGKLDAETQQLRTALAVMTRLRTLDATGQPSSYSGPPKNAPAGHRPWFEAKDRQSRKVEVLCGHWAAQGIHLAPGISALDSGAAWGGKLSALRLEDHQLFQVKATEMRSKAH